MLKKSYSLAALQKSGGGPSKGLNNSVKIDISRTPNFLKRNAGSAISLVNFVYVLIFSFMIMMAVWGQHSIYSSIFEEISGYEFGVTSLFSFRSLLLGG